MLYKLTHPEPILDVISLGFQVVQGRPSGELGKLKMGNCYGALIVTYPAPHKRSYELWVVPGPDSHKDLPHLLELHARDHRINGIWDISSITFEEAKKKQEALDSTFAP